MEEVNENISVGFTTNYIKVKVFAKLNKNEFYTIKMIKYENNFLIGELVNN